MTRRSKKKLDRIAFTATLAAFMGVLAWLFIATFRNGLSEGDYGISSRLSRVTIHHGDGSSTQEFPDFKYERQRKWKEDI